MKIIYEPSKYHQYAFEYNFSLELLEFCRWIKETEGWKAFGFLEKKWRFTDPKIIDIIRNRYPTVVIDPSLSNTIKQHELEKAQQELVAKAANELKTKTTSDLVVKGLKMELYPFQKVGVEFLVNNNGKAILADQMGLGKSAQALAYLVHAKVNSTLIVCPASMKYVWLGEVEKWTKLKAFVIDSRSELTIQDFHENQIAIINYDILKKFFEFLDTVHFDCMVLDESTYIKSPSTIRTKLVKALATKIASKILLSGTPIENRVIEIFTSLHFDGSHYME